MNRVTALAAGLMLLAVSAPASGDSPRRDTSPSARASTPSCSFAATRARAGGKPRKKHIVLSVRCNYYVELANFGTSRAVSAVRLKPTLEGAQPIDRMDCRKASQGTLRDPAGAPVTASCGGQVGANVRFKVLLRMKQNTCGHRKPLRVRMQTLGGVDCRGSSVACILIAYGTVRRDTLNC